MMTLQDYDNMMPNTVIAQGTGVNGTGQGEDKNPVMAEVMRGASFSWIAKRTATGWNIKVNGSELPIRNMTMIRKLVPVSDEALTYYSYN